MKFSFCRIVVVALSISFTAFAADPAIPDEAKLKSLIARFTPVEIVADLSHLPGNERLALRKMVEAAKIFDAVFLRQVSPLNESYLAELVRDDSPLGRARLHYFRLNAGPWSRLDHHAPFLPGVGEKPDGANFYPPDATREEVDTWLQKLPATERESAAGHAGEGEGPIGAVGVRLLDEERAARNVVHEHDPDR